jgi:hypothetical protein
MTMITKSKLAVVLAIATLGIASPALAQSSKAVNWNASTQSRSVDDPALTGGGSTGYNHELRTDY